MATESSPQPSPGPAPVPPTPRPPIPPTTPPPPAPPHPAPPRPAPTSAPVGWVIAAMIVFWPTGIPALLASHRSARAFGAAQTDVALREWADARRWSIISVCVGAGLIVLSVLASIVWVVLISLAVSSSVDDGVWDQGPQWSDELFDGPDRDQGR